MIMMSGVFVVRLPAIVNLVCLVPRLENTKEQHHPTLLLLKLVAGL
jgi:hypothetical protein